MATRRGWQFNPGCLDEPCCDEEEEEGCGPLCIDVRKGIPPSDTPAPGASLDGGDLGVEIANSSGRACFDIPGPGTYSFTVTLTGYRPYTFDVEVTEEDCDGGTIIEPVVLIPTTLPPGCQERIVVKCNGCIWSGAAVNIYYMFGGVDVYVINLVSRSDGMVYWCPPSGISYDNMQIEVIGNGTNYATARPAPEGDGAITGAFTLTHWCWPQHGCEGPVPSSLTFTGGGKTYTMPYDSVSGRYKSALIPEGGSPPIMGGFFQAQSSPPERRDPTNSCGPYVGWTVTITYYNYNMVQASLSQYAAFNPAPSGFSLYCPVNAKMFFFQGTTGYPDINGYLTE